MLNPTISIYQGLFIDHLEPEEIEVTYQQVMAEGGKGISIFDFNGLTKEFKESIKKVLNP